MRTHVILDTDIGSDVDDALALALAIASPTSELIAITTVAGNVRYRAKIARRLLELASRDDVPVYAGAAQPLGTGPGFVWFGTEGEGILQEADDRLTVEALPAVEALAQIISARPSVEIVAIGPLTNVAGVVQRFPHLLHCIKRLTIMGGHFRPALIGNRALPLGVDYNLCSDPEAAVIVFRSGIPIQLVTLDVSLQTWISIDDVACILSSGSPLLAAIAEASRIWMPVMHTIFRGFNASPPSSVAAFLHDPLALACATDEGFCSFEDAFIEPILDGGGFRTLESVCDKSEAVRLRCTSNVDSAPFARSF